MLYDLYKFILGITTYLPSEVIQQVGCTSELFKLSRGWGMLGLSSTLATMSDSLPLDRYLSGWVLSSLVCVFVYQVFLTDGLGPFLLNFLAGWSPFDAVQKKHRNKVTGDVETGFMKFILSMAPYQPLFKHHFM